ncbi:MAG: SelT/SelW/SelH family protein [Candidatus Eisenbacteria bacterium]|uniref:SelT/SelW/SelH family protein n=1 Tax=Eiseniibacteriota bacterium TaxID=2212470 RepID=A0A538TGY9_UNCEI|nr:MAG: SelT/SelW/SelH family protein [Candidatus Eisenbacteria bacterium]
MAAELKQNFGAESTLVPGGGGVFDVSVDGKIIFSKKSVGRFPEPGEIVGMLQKK